MCCFNQRNFHEAEGLYRQVLDIEYASDKKFRNKKVCIDALVSIAYCIKFRHNPKEIEKDNSENGVFS